MNINKKITKFLIIILLFMVLLFPVFSFAQDSSDCNSNSTDLSTYGGGLVPACPKGGCGFNEILIMINKVVNFILFVMAVPIAAVMFAYAGFLLVTSGGETSKRTKAKSIFTNVAVGFILAVAAWLIVNTVISILGYDACWIGFNCSNGSQSTPITTSNLTNNCNENQNEEGNLTVITEEDTWVLYRGGSLEEEGCPVQDQASTFNLFENLKTKKVIAQTEKSEKEINAEKIADEFRKARCWLALWYEKRLVPNSEIQSEYISIKKDFSDFMDKSVFEIVDSYKDPLCNGSYGYGAIAYVKIGEEGKSILRICDSVMLSEAYNTSLHEINHVVENNGRFYSKKENDFLNSKIFLETDFSRSFKEAFYNFIITNKPENQEEIKRVEEMINYFLDEFPKRENLSRCLDYIIYNNSINRQGCFSANILNLRLEEDNSVKFDYDFKYKPFCGGLYHNYSEIKSRLMVTRNVYNLTPDKEITLKKALEIIKNIEVAEELDIFNNFKIFQEDYHGYYDFTFETKYEDTSDLITTLLFSDLTTKACFLNEDPITDDTMIECDIYSNGDGSEKQKMEMKFSKFEEYERTEVAKKLLLLLNNSI